VVHGSPGLVLEQLARTADLLVVGSRGLGIGLSILSFLGSAAAVLIWVL
jgi:nucleotide-binding universal stress UspA family protein